MQVLDGGTVDVAERAAIVVLISTSSTVINVVEGNGVAATVEGALEAQVLVDTQHGGRKT